MPRPLDPSYAKHIGRLLALPRDPRDTWESECLAFHGRILTGAGAHWCHDFDDLSIDETCEEWAVCDCSARPTP